VEIDVQLSRDGKLFVFHDHNLKRITGLDAHLGELSAARLRRLDAGAWFSEGFRGEKIPYLDEVFELLGDRVYYDLELKWRKRQSGGIEAAVYRCIRAHKLEDRCLVSSFNPFTIRTFQSLAPNFPTACIYSRQAAVPIVLRHGQGQLIAPTPFIKPRFPQVHALSAFLYRQVFKRQILTWTVDEPEEAARLIHLGVRGIISNHPGKIKAALPRSIE